MTQHAETPETRNRDDRRDPDSRSRRDGVRGSGRILPPLTRSYGDLVAERGSTHPGPWMLRLTIARARQHNNDNNRRTSGSNER